MARSREGSDLGGRAAVEVLSDQQLQGAEMALRQVLEAPAAGDDRLIRRFESLDRPEQVLVVFAELQLHGGAEDRVAGQGQRRLGPVAARIDQRPKAQPLE